MEIQQDLLTATVRVEKPWKRQRDTARQVYAEQRAIDVAKAEAGHETREGQVLRILSWHWSATQISPTAQELLQWARAHGETLFDINSIRPRLTALVDAGLVDVPRDSLGKVVKRACLVSKKRVTTWIIREAGSQQPR